MASVFQSIGRSGGKRATDCAACGLIVISLAGCMVGPDYKRPETKVAGQFAGLDKQVSGDGLASKPNQEPLEISRWWREFNDEKLTELIGRAQQENLDVAVAIARIRQARAQVMIATGGLFPSVSLGASYQQARSPLGGLGTGGNGRITNFYQVGFDASWELDVFGGIRRQIEAANANLDASFESRDDALVTMAGEIGTNYINLRGAQSQLAIARSNLEAQEQTLALTKERFDAGFVSALDVANAQAQVASTRSQVPVLEGQIRTSIYAIGVLLGEEPATLLAELTPQRQIPRAPSAVPVGIPSELLQRRPDIRRAEATLHAATAQIGAAIANLYPQFNINGSIGLQGGNAGDLGTIANHYWSYGPGANWLVFDGGQTRGNIELQRGVTDEAFATYKQTVLVALRDTETALVNFTAEQKRRVSLAEAVEANKQAVDLSMQLYSNGRTDFLNVLVAQRQLFLSEDALAQSEANVSTNLVALYKALGGGWGVEDGGEGIGPPAQRPEAVASTTEEAGMSSAIAPEAAGAH
ncbi:MAG: efflux transporter outer membrane subunit [Phycisphaerales bacterium]|nr:efflux transporter outer membrane subunit [Planctomycetota bacterium]